MKQAVYEIIIFYKYTFIQNPLGFMKWQRHICESLHLKGRILIAQEGINGTVEGTKQAIKTYCEHMHAQDGKEETFGDFSDMWFKSSPGNGNAFKKLKVKVRDEIVTTGLSHNERIQSLENTGEYLHAQELKKWFENKEDFEIIDMRNEFEYKVGHFAGSHNSQMQHFRDLSTVPKRFEAMKDKKILTVCTYGVRCEKASAYLKQKGFKRVYQLHGGIGTYMKQFPGEDFMGSLYVFDHRMTEQFTDAYQVVGSCFVCDQKTEHFEHCALHECHKQLLICDQCTHKRVYCTENCQEKHQLMTLEKK